jgi:hypothetical protein
MTIKRNPNASSTTGAPPSVGPGLHGYTQDGVNRVLWPVQGVYAVALGIVFAIAIFTDGKTNHDFMYWFITSLVHNHNSFLYQDFAPAAAWAFLLAVFGAFGWHIMRGSGETEYLHHWNYHVRRHFMDKYQGPFHSIQSMYSGLLSTVGLVFIVFTMLTNFGGVAIWIYEAGVFDGASGWGLCLPIGFSLILCTATTLFILFFSHLLLPPLALFIKTTWVGYKDGKQEKKLYDIYNTQQEEAAKTGKLWDVINNSNGQQHP